MNVIAFHEAFVPSSSWRFTQEEMRAGLVADGLHEYSHMNMDLTTARLLLAPETYTYSLLTFQPNLEDLWLFKSPPVSISTRLESGEGYQRTAVTMVVSDHSERAHIPVDRGALNGPSVTTSAASTQNVVAIATISSDAGGIGRASGPGFAVETRLQANSLGRSFVEEQHVILSDGSHVRVLISSDGPDSRVERHTALSKPYKQRKGDEEWAAGLIFARGYNRVHGTALTLSKPDEDRDADLLIGTQRVQVSKCSPKQMFHALAREGHFADTVTLEQIQSEVRSAIDGKRRHHYSTAAELILLLDGGFSDVPAAVLEDPVTFKSSALQNHAFREIWYVSRAPQRAIRLFP